MRRTFSQSDENWQKLLYYRVGKRTKKVKKRYQKRRSITETPKAKVFHAGSSGRRATRGRLNEVIQRIQLQKITL